jgi:predicted lipoprotein with Yx(FWY)xxD motif
VRTVQRHQLANAEADSRTTLAALGLRLVGGGLLFGTAAIHLDLYLTGYRTIPTIGYLFLLQVISGFAIGVLVLATGRRVISAGGAGFALATLAGYLTSLHESLFGFREVRTPAGIAAGTVEVLAFATLSALALRPTVSSTGARKVRSRLSSRLPQAVAAGLTIVAGVLLGLSLASSATSSADGSSSGHVTLLVTSIDGHQVVTNSQGFTLYWFGPDTSTTSACYGSCAAYWPAVTGTPVAGSGLSGTFGTIRRTDGSIQATYDGHPLYTYIGDSAPGQNHGNGVTLNGGQWFEMPAG